jgi:tetratricopeptide (TPR) repeat protein
VDELSIAKEQGLVEPPEKTVPASVEQVAAIERYEAAVKAYEANYEALASAVGGDDFEEAFKKAAEAVSEISVLAEALSAFPKTFRRIDGKALHYTAIAAAAGKAEAIRWSALSDLRERHNSLLEEAREHHQQEQRAALDAAVGISSDVGEGSNEDLTEEAQQAYWDYESAWGNFIHSMVVVIPDICGGQDVGDDSFWVDEYTAREALQVLNEAKQMLPRILRLALDAGSSKMRVIWP